MLPLNTISYIESAATPDPFGNSPVSRFISSITAMCMIFKTGLFRREANTGKHILGVQALRI